MAQQSASDRIWSQSIERKKDELTTLLALLEHKRNKKPNDLSQVPVITLDEAVQNSDLQSFQSAVEALAQQFAHKKVSALVTKYLYPSLDHVRSFHSGISSATQYEPNAALAWGILLIVIQCGCIFAESIEEIMCQLGALQSLLPFLEKDLSLYPNIRSLEISLRTIFEGYIDFCLAIVRHLAKNPAWVLLSNLTSSSLRRTLKKAKEKLKSDVADFDRAVDSAERTRAIQADDAIIQSQSQQLLLLTKSSNATSQAHLKVQFPFQHMIIARNPDFTGRDDELEKLSTWLQTHTEARPLSCTIHGIGGVGKTETATELAYRCQNMFDVILWVPADPKQETETLRTFGHIGRKLGLFETAEVSDPQAEIVLDWLQNQEQRWLIIFDNVEEWKNVSRYWPMKSRKPSAIIVTSQMVTPWTDHQLDLEPFDDVSGSKFLLQQMHMSQLLSDDTTLTIAGEVSKELGGSPLYLTHAQGFMSLSGSTLEGYLDIIRTGSSTLDMKSNSTWRYGRAVSATHDKILEKLSSGATSLLFMFAFMNPDDISEDLLLDVKTQPLEFLKDRSKYISFIAELGEGRLVRRTPYDTRYRLEIHRATQAAMRQKLSKSAEQRNLHFQKVIHLLRENFLGILYDDETPDCGSPRLASDHKGASTPHENFRLF